MTHVQKKRKKLCRNLELSFLLSDTSSSTTLTTVLTISRRCFLSPTCAKSSTVTHKTKFLVCHLLNELLPDRSGKKVFEKNIFNEIKTAVLASPQVMRTIHETGKKSSVRAATVKAEEIVRFL